MADLTDKQRLFVAEYLVDLNAAAAYQRAGYKATGAAARTNASRLLTNANVAAAISEAFEARIERTEITPLIGCSWSTRGLPSRICASSRSGGRAG